jgi:hypothetical protein
MQHYAKLETTEFYQEEDGCSEEDTTFDLQCGDSLNIAVNHIGADVFGVKQLLLHSFRDLRRPRGRRS